MRRLPALVAVTALAGAALVGCSASASPSCSAPASDSRVADAVTTSGDIGTLPRVEVRSPLVVNDRSVATETVGSGLALTNPDQLVLLDLSVYDGKTGTSIVSSKYDGDPRAAVPLKQWDQTFPGFSEALSCATEGSRVVVALPYDQIGQEAAQGLGLPEGATTVVVVDVRKTYLPAAEGADQFNAGFGLPSVVRAPGGQPGVVVPDGGAPDQVQTQVLKKGDGAEVTADAGVRIHVLGVAWSTRKQFVSTWDTGSPVTAVPSQLPTPLKDALVGQTVGSQVMVVVPADQTADDQTKLRAPADTALVYVVDVLGLDG